MKQASGIFSKIKNNPLLMSSLWTLIARFTGVALNFAVVLLITNTLTKNAAGDLLLLMTFITGIALISRLGIDQFLMKEVASAHDSNWSYRKNFHYNSIKATLLLSLVFMLLWILFAKLIQLNFFQDNNISTVSLTELIFASLGILFFNFVIINSTYLKAMKKSVLGILGQNALTAITFLLLIGLFWKVFSNDQNTIYLYTFSLILAGCISFLLLRQRKKDIPHSHEEIETLKIIELIKKSIPFAPISIISFLMIFTDTIMVGWFLPNEQVAEYSVASRVSYIVLFFLQAMEATIYPRLLNKFKHDKDNILSFFWQSTALVVIVVLCVTLIMYLLSYWILLAFGKEYLVASSALTTLLIAQLLRAASITFSFMFIIREKVQFLNMILVVAFITNIICNIFLIQSNGIEGAATATLIANAVLAGLVIVIFKVKKLLPKAVGIGK